MTRFTALTTSVLLAFSVRAASLQTRADPHNFTITSNNPSLDFGGPWGAYNTFLPIEGCPEGVGMVATGGDANASVGYTFTGNAVYATLVSNAANSIDCTGTITIDGTPHSITVPARAGANGDGMACTTVKAPEKEPLGDGEHTAVLTMNGQADKTRCPFIFVQFQVTTTTDQLAPVPPNPPSSETQSGTGTATEPSTRTGGATPSGSVTAGPTPPGDGVAAHGASVVVAAVAAAIAAFAA